MEQKVTSYLRQMKEATGCTQQQIADESGVPIGTVGKYLAGIADEAAGYDAVRRLVVCLGGSLDELAGLNTDAQKAEGDAGQAYKAVIAGLEARLDEKGCIFRVSARTWWRISALKPSTTTTK